MQLNICALLLCLLHLHVAVASKGSIQHTTSIDSTKSNHIDNNRKINLNVIYNDERIGKFDDDVMKRFKPVSSHGREDVFNDELNDNTMYYKLQLTSRAISHLINFFPVLATSLLAYLSTDFRNYVWFYLIRRALGNSGAAFIKWGQWSSTRPDIFPEELCNSLAKLQTQAPVHSYEFTRYTIKKEIGFEINDIFDSFDREALASGSIAQVYRAVLDGQQVAVKVRHPNVYEQIKLDFTIMKAIANFLDANIPGMQWLNLPESLAQFSGTIASQTKLDIEGRHLVQFNRHFKRWTTAFFPKPVFFTDAVLVESFEFGDTVASFAKQLAKENAKNIRISKHDLKLAHFVVTVGEDVYLKMLIEDNLMHADLHPGNILIQQKTKDGQTIIKSNNVIKDNSNYVDLSTYPPELIETNVVLVDAGMVACLTYDERSNFIGLIEAVGEGNGEEAAEYLLKFSSKHTSYSNEMKSAFKQDVRILFLEICRGYGTNVNMGQVLRGILNTIRKHHVAIDANYATLFLNVLCLDGLASTLLPTYNVLDGAKNFLRFHRFSRKFPFPWIKNKLIKFGIPIARRMKKIFDDLILHDLIKSYDE